VIVLDARQVSALHIGESLLPSACSFHPPRPPRENSPGPEFMEKFGGEMYGAAGDDGVKLFRGRLSSQTDRSYQSHACRLRQGPARSCRGERRGSSRRNDVSMTSIFRTTRHPCDFATAEWRFERIQARYVDRRRRRNSILSAKFKLKKNYEHLQKVSIFAHYDGMSRAEVAMEP